VGVSHAHQHQLSPALSRDQLSHRTIVALKTRRTHRLRAQPGHAHLHPHLGYLPALHLKPQPVGAGRRLNHQLTLAHQAMVVGKLTQTADAVTAHLRPAAVGIEIDHPQVLSVGAQGHHQNGSISPDTTVAVT